MLALALILAAGTAPPATPKAPGRVAVLDVKLSADVPPALGPWLAQVLASEVGARTGAAPLVRADIVALLGFEREKRLLGCEGDDVSCIIEIGGALGASRVLVSSLSAVGSRYLLTLTLVEGRTATSLGRVAEMCLRDEDALLETVRRAAGKLLGGGEPARPPAPAAPPAVAAPPGDGGQGGRPGLFATRRGWALVAGVGALAFAGAGAGLGASALSSARSGDAGALSRAHLADALFGAALVAGGAGVYLWLSAPAPDAPEPAGARAALGVAPLPGGLVAGLEGRW